MGIVLQKTSLRCTDRKQLYARVSSLPATAQIGIDSELPLSFVLKKLRAGKSTETAAPTLPAVAVTEPTPVANPDPEVGATREPVSNVIQTQIAIPSEVSMGESNELPPPAESPAATQDQAPAADDEEPLFILLDGPIKNDTWQAGWIQPVWVQEALNVIDPWVATNDNGDADELKRGKLQHQHLLVQLSMLINEITTQISAAMMLDNIDDTVATIRNWVKVAKITQKARAT